LQWVWSNLNSNRHGRFITEHGFLKPKVTSIISFSVARFEIFMTAKIEFMVFWVAAPCSMVEVAQSSKTVSIHNTEQHSTKSQILSCCY
jgi:hypothetical protein